MFEEVKWLFFDVGSTLVYEHIVYEHRMREIADLAHTTYEKDYNNAMKLYKQNKKNKKGDLEIVKTLGEDLPKRHQEDEILYKDTAKCLEFLSKKYKISIIANQSLGTQKRLEQYGIITIY